MNIIIRCLLPSLHPEVLKTQFIFPLGLVTSPEVGMLSGEPAKPVRISVSSVVTPKIMAKHAKHETLALIAVTSIFYLGSCLLRRSYTAWFETVTAETNPDTLIGAPQAEVDLEAQPLNFPPMPDTFEFI
jgi:hypothetical protein